MPQVNYSFTWPALIMIILFFIMFVTSIIDIKNKKYEKQILPTIFSVISLSAIIFWSSGFINKQAESDTFEYKLTNDLVIEKESNDKAYMVNTKDIHGRKIYQNEAYKAEPYKEFKKGDTVKFKIIEPKEHYLSKNNLSNIKNARVFIVLEDMELVELYNKDVINQGLDKKIEEIYEGIK